MSDHGFGSDTPPPPPPPPPPKDEGAGGRGGAKDGADNPYEDAGGSPGQETAREETRAEDKSGNRSEDAAGDENGTLDQESPKPLPPSDEGVEDQGRPKDGADDPFDEDAHRSPVQETSEAAVDGAEDNDEVTDNDKAAAAAPDATETRTEDAEAAPPVTDPPTEGGPSPAETDGTENSDAPPRSKGPDTEEPRASDDDRTTTPDADETGEPDRDGTTAPDQEKGSDPRDRTGSDDHADDESHDPAETGDAARAGASPVEDGEASEQSEAATSAPEPATHPVVPVERDAESPAARPDAAARVGEGAPESSGPGSEPGGQHSEGAHTEDVPPRQKETSEQQPQEEDAGRTEGSADLSSPADGATGPESEPDGRPQRGDNSEPAGTSSPDTGGSDTDTGGTAVEMGGSDADTGFDSGVEAGIKTGAAVGKAALDVTGTITGAVGATVSEAAAGAEANRAMAGVREDQGSRRSSPDIAPDTATSTEDTSSEGPEDQRTSRADAPEDPGADAQDGSSDHRLTVVRESLGDQHPEVTSVLSKLITDDTNRLDLTEGLKEPRRAEVTMGIVKEVAEGRLLGQEGSLESYTAKNPGRGPLFDRVSDDINSLDGASRKDAYVQESKAADPEARSLGPDVSGEQSGHLRDYAGRLKHELEPTVFEDVIGLIERLPDAEGVEFSARTKSADGLVDKVQRMTSGSEGRPARPDYQVGDVIDAVGARVTAKDTAQLESLLEGAKEYFGTGREGGRILEIENMYAQPKGGNPNYRVIPMVVSIDAGGKPYTYELQLTTKRASVAADLEHNTVYKDHVNASDDEKRVVRNMQAEAAALDQEETIRRHPGDK